MVDVYNKDDKGCPLQAKKARLAHLGDYVVELKQELKQTLLEMERLSHEVEFGDQSGD